ncbi:hypothetical protein M501DRAFT_1013898 [Patellaria atrata CBS 101060]|uniref:Uncharacterized protein n=1 Tax=Patellaria atrata CBS 101060 TaxID=1346257 RepID=A0A9P4SHF2_9PEZI|nr:hypothetical protein M501DRAFT_1013898 [Patellaria atrata CBS 101060]
MSPLFAPTLFKQTRLSPSPASTKSIVHITFPPHATTNLSVTKAAHKHEIINNDPVDLDEEEFAKWHLATESNVHFSRRNGYPRMFLWRILDDRRVLEVQCADLVAPHDEKAIATLTLRFTFPKRIYPFGVSFAEPKRGLVVIYVLTEKGQLYTLNLGKEAFVRPGSSEGTDWWDVWYYSSLSFKQPYRLFAAKEAELWISLTEGSLVRLQRKGGEHGKALGWDTLNFGNSTRKGYIFWASNKQSLKFRDHEIDTSSVADVAFSPDGKTLWTVSLDHTLKSRNLETRAIGLHMDLFGDGNESQQKGLQHLIGPEQPKLMQIVQVPGSAMGSQYYVVVYSPLKHQFKFWQVTDADDPISGITELQPNVSFVPPMDELMDTTVWNLEEFHLTLKHSFMEMELWIRVRSGPNCRIFGLRFDLSDTAKLLKLIWRNNWLSVDQGNNTIDALEAHPTYPGETDQYNSEMHRLSASELWLDFLFYPGRFTIATLETSLVVYRRSVESVLNGAQSSSGNLPLKERLVNAIQTKAQAGRTHTGEIDHDRLDLDISSQWHVYYGIVRDLHIRRAEPLALAYDEQEELPVVLEADSITLVRTSSEVELLVDNVEELISQEELPASHPLIRALQDNSSIDVAALFHAASCFRKSLPKGFGFTLSQAINAEILQNPLFSISERIQTFDDRSNLCISVTDDDFNKLSTAIDNMGGFQSLDNDILFGAIMRLGAKQQGRHQTINIPVRFGRTALICGAQETVELSRQVLRDLLVLVVFLALEIEPAELSAGFDAAELFTELLDVLKGYEMIWWMTSRSRRETAGHTLPKLAVDGKTDTVMTVEDVSVTQTLVSTSSSYSSSHLIGTLTIAEDLFLGDFDNLMTPSDMAFPALLTYWIRAWTFQPLLHSREAFGQLVLGDLIKNENWDAAEQWISYAVDTPWTTYLRARVDLGRGRLELAARNFRRAGFGLAIGFFDLNDADIPGLLHPDEHVHFSGGMASYFQHIIALFERLRAHAYVIDFANMALENIGSYGSGSHEENTKTDLLSRLFTALIYTERFEEAYATLCRFTNSALRYSSLRTLISSICTSQLDSSLLLRLPLGTLHQDVDVTLLSLARKASSPIATGPDYYKILYAYRISRNDFRGAASCLWERLGALKASKGGGAMVLLDESITDGYILVINTLRCVDPTQAWILADPLSETQQHTTLGSVARKIDLSLLGKVKKEERRKVVTLEDVQNELARQLDQRSGVERGRFAFVSGEDEMVG